MKTFYILLAAIALAGGAVAFDRLTGSAHRSAVQVVVAFMLAVIFVALIRFLVKLRD